MLPNEWERVLKNLSRQFVEGESQIGKILALSYEDLPYHLKSCFLYIGVYPEDYEFFAKELNRLWGAEGFVQTLEEATEDCLVELIQRSLIQIVKRSSIGGVKSCQIHDLLRDLSISKAKEEKFLDGDTNSLSPCKARRLNMHHGISKYTSLNQSTPCLRSILCFTLDTEKVENNQLKLLCGRFHFRRVLHLHKIEVEEFPNEIGTLIHLRYLAIQGEYNLERLPSSIANLRNLQTLEVDKCDGIDVPSVIWKMQQLRHVRVQGRIISEGPKAGELSFPSNLQTLKYIEAGDWIEDCLGKLINLKKLGISTLELSGHVKELLDSIPKLDHLQSLTLRGSNSRRIPFPPILNLQYLYKLNLVRGLEKLPESCEFSPNLTKFTLSESKLMQDPMTTLEKLPNFRILKLLAFSYLGREMVCSAQGFPQLDSLFMCILPNLEEWRVEEGAMQRLVHLHMSQWFQLKMFPEGLQHVTALRKLELYHMSRSFTNRLQQDMGEDWHKIQHIPSVNIFPP
ncbi:probable disease resistance RPP8-like protein 2 [Magnolia sinica]|uniref:probable disease resistance RPP8-like protein 2 n=1 Tax=Magnolia sinica TaxID=86752 RepID=UPI0026593F10|nr:probable disease resistance RPP8-like protein 2 [Magnolia sinica]XP_058115505.1 probable disease resistance RPP8-like protein 2 [Magnolia sinica]XP_058115506.1 probable disease resistance RPP8-like protein 2 [Magnolia sinica]